MYSMQGERVHEWATVGATVGNYSFGDLVPVGDVEFKHLEPNPNAVASTLPASAAAAVAKTASQHAVPNPLPSKGGMSKSQTMRSAPPLP